jgi:hypothetical protein
MTNYPEGSGFTGNVDTLGSFLWNNSRPIREGTLTYGRDSIVAITTLMVSNVDNYLDDLANTHTTLRETPVEWWRGHFNKSDATIFLGSIQVFKGVIGRINYGDEAQISLGPPRSSVQSRVPKRRFTLQLFTKLPLPNLKITWGGESSLPPPHQAPPFDWWRYWNNP